MKIAVCGKGGCGKSTITSLLAKELARMGNKVLVIDSDESNYGLHKQLGMEFPGDFPEYFGGKIHEANEGCACTMESILKELLAHLDLKKNEFAIADMEAGIEHFGRGVDNSADVILMIIDPSFESLCLSQKIKELSQSIGKPVYFCLNRVTKESIGTMIEMVSEKNNVVCQMPVNSEILKAGLKGDEFTGEYSAIKEMAKKLLE